MPSSLRILADVNNAVASSTVTASSILPAKNSAFRQQTARAGNGSVRIAGGYTGADDTMIEIEIVAPATGNERASQPVFAGAGNGTMDAPTLSSGVEAQDVTVTLTDLGTTTVAAQAILYAEVIVRAKATGAAGNAITLSITPALTIDTSAVGALGADLAIDAQEWSDQKLDFGAVPLNADGTVPVTAPRLIFGMNQSQVYRHYKRWDGNQWQYGVSPKLAAAFATGALVNTVTGSYTATLTDGTTTETHTGLVTLYDLLLALSSSELVTLGTPPANDLTPGGMAAVEIPFRTAAFALPTEKSRTAMPDLIGVVVDSDAPTESIAIECVSVANFNGETWKVSGPVSGTLSSATTGTAYDDGPIGFTIPTQPVETTPITGRIGISGISYATRADGEGEPAICLYQPLLGAAASNKTLTLVYTKRPSTECQCTDSSVSGHPLEDLLGIDLGDTAMSALVAGHRARLESLAAWLKGFVAANTAKTTAGELRSADYDIQLASLAAVELNDCLDAIYTDADAILSEAAWVAGTAYKPDDVVESASRNGYRYRVTVAGTSAASAPTWPTTIGVTVTDGTVTWKCVSKTAPLTWDAVLSGLSTDLSSLSAIGTEAGTVIPAYLPDTAYTVGTIVSAPIAGGAGVVYVKCVSAGTSSSSPVLGVAKIEIGDTFSSGGITWLRISREEANALKSGDAGDINSVADVIDDPAILRTPEEFVKRYITACNEVRAIAGLPPKKSEASLEWNRVWRDLGGDYWAFSGEDYLPAFSNTYYHAAVKDCDGVPISTYEFGFAIRVGCIDRLKYGDTVTITIGDVSVQRAYEVGDIYTIPIVKGSPLALTGGVTGTDTQTWIVRGSVSGALADYALGADEAAYSDGGLAFTIHRGGIDFALGDAFTFSVTVGEQFRWRRDSGSWSADTAVVDSVDLADGLSAVFTSGPSPSFVLNDLHQFQVIQPNAPSHTQSAGVGSWRWSGTDATLTIAWDSDQSIQAVGVLAHELSGSSTCSMTLKDAAGATLTVVSLSTGAGPRLAFLDAPLLVRSIVVTVSEADGMALGWAYAGIPLATSHQPASCRIDRSYALARSGAINPRGVYLGAGRGGEIVWTDWLLQSDLDALLEIVDAAKAAGDAPICVVPSYQKPAEAALCRIDSDSIQISDLFEFQPNNDGRRRLSLTLPLAAVMQ